MARKAKVVDIPALGNLDRAKGQLVRQLTETLREAVQRGELRPGEPLPSSRLLASSLKIARGTVLEAYGQTGHGDQGTVSAPVRSLKAEVRRGQYVFNHGGSVAGLVVARKTDLNEKTEDPNELFWRVKALLYLAHAVPAKRR